MCFVHADRRGALALNWECSTPPVHGRGSIRRHKSRAGSVYSPGGSDRGYHSASGQLQGMRMPARRTPARPRCKEPPLLGRGRPGGPTPAAACAAACAKAGHLPSIDLPSNNTPYACMWLAFCSIHSGTLYASIKDGIIDIIDINGKAYDRL